MGIVYFNKVINVFSKIPHRSTLLTMQSSNNFLLPSYPSTGNSGIGVGFWWTGGNWSHGACAGAEASFRWPLRQLFGACLARPARSQRGPSYGQCSRKRNTSVRRVLQRANIACALLAAWGLFWWNFKERMPKVSFVFESVLSLYRNRLPL